MMSLVSGFLTVHSPPMRHRPSRKELCYIIMDIIEDQLYEDLLKSGEVVLLTKSSNYEVSSATTRRLFAVTLG